MTMERYIPCLTVGAAALTDKTKGYRQYRRYCQYTFVLSVRAKALTVRQKVYPVRFLAEFFSKMLE